jgi:hypothetical protein
VGVVARVLKAHEGIASEEWAVNRWVRIAHDGLAARIHELNASGVLLDSKRLRSLARYLEFAIPVAEAYERVIEEKASDA